MGGKLAPPYQIEKLEQYQNRVEDLVLAKMLGQLIKKARENSEYYVETEAYDQSWIRDYQYFDQEDEEKPTLAILKHC